VCRANPAGRNETWFPDRPVSIAEQRIPTTHLDVCREIAESQRVRPIPMTEIRCRQTREARRGGNPSCFRNAWSPGPWQLRDLFIDPRKFIRMSSADPPDRNRASRAGTIIFPSCKCQFLQQVPYANDLAPRRHGPVSGMGRIWAKCRGRVRISSVTFSTKSSRAQPIERLGGKLVNRRERDGNRTPSSGAGRITFKHAGKR